MNASNQRSWLLQLAQAQRKKGPQPTGWEFNRIDELELFEFIHPSVNTRDPAFRLFNLPVNWDVGGSALVDEFGKRTSLDLQSRLAGDELRRASPNSREREFTMQEQAQILSNSMVGEPHVTRGDPRDYGFPE